MDDFGDAALRPAVDVAQALCQLGGTRQTALGIVIDAARDVVLRLIYQQKDNITSDALQRNYKGELLELIQARGNGMPRYDVVWERGPDHEKQFKVVVTVGDRRIGNGVGLSKKEAEQKAAAMALEEFSSESK